MGSGVTVTIVYPGAVRTERLAETLGQNVEPVPTMSPGAAPNCPSIEPAAVRPFGQAPD